MIYDKLENLKLYAGCNEGLSKAVRFISQMDFDSLTLSDISVDGKDIYGFYKVFPFKNEKEALYESHRKYIDIQLVLKGEERILCTDTKKLKTVAEYNEENDIEFYADAEKYVDITLSEKEFVILFPDDAHKPCLFTESSSESHKVVFKIKLF